MKVVILAWVFFVVTGVFIAIVTPLGEGFDEPWHLGYIQHLAETGRPPAGPESHLSSDLETFLLSQPIGWRLKPIFPMLRSHDEYWQSNETDRLRPDDRLRGLHFNPTYKEGAEEFSKQYESHQAPLYYLLMAPLFWLCSRLLSLADTFLVIRLASLLLASTTIPLIYTLTKRISASYAVPPAAALIAGMFPGIFPDVVRVSNDALAVPLAAAIFATMARYVDSESRRDAALLGFLLLAGLCTKAFFVPVLLAILAGMIGLKRFRDSGLVFAATLPGWIWYLRNFWVTGSMTGLPETVSANTTLASSLNSVTSIGWAGVLKWTAVSHIWMGNWSLLQYRSWIYETVMGIFAVGLAGFLIVLIKPGSRTIPFLTFVYAVFAASLAYYATQVFQQTGTAVIQGWYLSPMVPLETMMFVLGIERLLRRRFMTGMVVFVGVCFLAMVVYGYFFIAAPYYTGLIDHAASGHLRAYHPNWADMSLMTSRLSRMHSWIPVLTLPALALAIPLIGFSLLWSYYESSH